MIDQPSGIPPFSLRRLLPSDVACYRSLRLEGLQRHPDAFGASWEDEVGKPLTWFSERLERCLVLGGFRDDGLLVGTAGLLVPENMKTRHKGTLWGMYVRPDARGTGLAAALVGGVIEKARPLVEEIQLRVVTSNLGAVQLYRRAGFREYGVERRSLKVNGTYHDDLLMSLPLRDVG